MCPIAQLAFQKRAAAGFGQQVDANFTQLVATNDTEKRDSVGEMYLGDKRREGIAATSTRPSNAGRRLRLRLPAGRAYAYRFLNEIGCKRVRFRSRASVS